MKLAPLAAAGLIAVTACHQSPQRTAIDANAAAMEASLENQADDLEALADNAADRNASQAMQNAADDMKDMRDNVANAADAAKDNLQ